MVICMAVDCKSDSRQGDRTLRKNYLVYKVLPMTLTKTYEKGSETVSQRCFYGKLFLKYAAIYAECAYFLNSFSLEHLGLLVKTQILQNLKKYFLTCKSPSKRR